MPLTGGAVERIDERDGRVARLRISRPDRMNTITWEMRGRVADHFADIDADDRVQVVVIDADPEGGHFTAGGDIPGFMELGQKELTALGQRLTAPSRSPKPVIVAIDGFCLGAGLELSMSCDVRLATRRSEFGQPEMRLGMIPGSGGTQRLARLLGLSRAKWFVMTGERFTAEQAHEWGLVARLADDRDGLDKVVDELLDTLLGYSPLALRTAKEVLDRGVDAPLATGIELERKAYSMLRGSDDFAEGVDAFVEKRRPEFTGR